MVKNWDCNDDGRHCWWCCCWHLEANTKLSFSLKSFVCVPGVLPLLQSFLDKKSLSIGSLLVLWSWLWGLFSGLTSAGLIESACGWSESVGLGVEDCGMPKGKFIDSCKRKSQHNWRGKDQGLESVGEENHSQKNMRIEFRSFSISANRHDSYRRKGRQSSIGVQWRERFGDIRDRMAFHSVPFDQAWLLLLWWCLLRILPWWSGVFKFTIVAGGIDGFKLFRKRRWGTRFDVRRFTPLFRRWCRANDDGRWSVIAGNERAICDEVPVGQGILLFPRLWATSGGPKRPNSPW